MATVQRSLYSTVTGAWEWKIGGEGEGEEAYKHCDTKLTRAATTVRFLHWLRAFMLFLRAFPFFSRGALPQVRCIIQYFSTVSCHAAVLSCVLSCLLSVCCSILRTGTQCECHNVLKGMCYPYHAKTKPLGPMKKMRVPVVSDRRGRCMWDVDATCTNATDGGGVGFFISTTLAKVSVFNWDI
jgi:hypothetical protein